MVKNRDKLKEHLTPASTFLVAFMSLFHSWLICILPVAQEVQRVWGYSQFITVPLCFSFIFTLFPVAMWVLPMSFRIKLLQSGLFTRCSSWCIHLLPQGHLYSGAWTPPFPSPLTLVFSLFCLTLHFFSALWCFGPFLNVLSLDEPPAWLLGSALSRWSCISHRAAPGLPERALHLPHSQNLDMNIQYTQQQCLLKGL